MVIPGVRPTLPVVQGGMAIRISMALAGAVAREAASA
jgi:NAD(P)H-dependent flavin oxidoreductase YrpB (nitropropane dioxygenase family)